MKKILLFIPIMMVVVFFNCSNPVKKTHSDKKNNNNVDVSFSDAKVFDESADKTPVQKYGQLQIIKKAVYGYTLCDSAGNPVQLRGMSSHGLQWYPEVMNHDSIKWLRDYWGISVIRAAMYVEANGYLSSPVSMENKVKEIVDAAKDLGIYVLIDWHILSDGDPNIHKNDSKTFFQEMATTYGSYPNVMYEICNEPNGSGVTWTSKIRPYADEICTAIRAIDPDNIIIVGTGTWSQDIQDASSSPLTQSNIMYALHFYAGTHGQSLRDRIAGSVSNIAIFVTEWGTSEASGNGGPYTDLAKVWLDYLKSMNISWCNWSLCDKAETSAALMPGANIAGNWGAASVSLSGKFVKYNMTDTH